MTYALFKVHGNSNINMSSTTEALKNYRLAGTRFVSYNYIKVQTIKLHCCDKYFKLYGCELSFTWDFVYSIYLIEIAIGMD
jgi:hypothetical protein